MKESGSSNGYDKGKGRTNQVRIAKLNTYCMTICFDRACFTESRNSTADCNALSVKDSRSAASSSMVVDLSRFSVLSRSASIIVLPAFDPSMSLRFPNSC